MPKELRSDLDAALDLLCQKIERRVVARLTHDAGPSYDTGLQLDKADAELRLAVSAFNQEASNLVALERDEHFARVIEENTRLVQ